MYFKYKKNYSNSFSHLNNILFLLKYYLFYSELI